jgi:hypothetical protein
MKKSIRYLEQSMIGLPEIVTSFRKDEWCDEFSHLRVGQEVPSEWLGDYDTIQKISGELPSVNLSKATALREFVRRESETFL